MAASWYEAMVGIIGLVFGLFIETKKPATEYRAGLLRRCWRWLRLGGYRQSMMTRWGRELRRLQPQAKPAINQKDRGGGSEGLIFFWTAGWDSVSRMQ